jgi:hypothetical protein
MKGIDPGSGARASGSGFEGKPSLNFDFSVVLAGARLLLLLLLLSVSHVLQTAVGALISRSADAATGLSHYQPKSCIKVLLLYIKIVK